MTVSDRLLQPAAFAAGCFLPQEGTIRGKNHISERKKREKTLYHRRKKW